MLLSDEEVQERIVSPSNLLNRLRNATKANSPLLPVPKSEDLIPNLDGKLTPSVKKQAADILAEALRELKMRIPDVQRPEKLAQIAAEMNKVLIAREDEDKTKNQPQFIIYAPQVIQESQFQQIVLKEESR